MYVYVCVIIIIIIVIIIIVIIKGIYKAQDHLNVCYFLTRVYVENCHKNAVCVCVY